MTLPPVSQVDPELGKRILEAIEAMSRRLDGLDQVTQKLMQGIFDMNERLARTGEAVHAQSGFGGGRLMDGPPIRLVQLQSSAPMHVSDDGV